MKRYLFAKFLKSLSVEELMEKVAEAGLDSPTALIRDGYWLTENNLKDELPRYIKAAESAGLEVKKASTSYSPESIVKDETPLKVFSKRPDLTALLDVTLPEPLPPESTIFYMPNINVSTHIAGAINSEKLRIGDKIIDAFFEWVRFGTVRDEITIEMLDKMA